MHNLRIFLCVWAAHVHMPLPCCSFHQLPPSSSSSSYGRQSLEDFLHTNFSNYSCHAMPCIMRLSFNELFNPQFIKLISMLWGFILCVHCINTFGWIYMEGIYEYFKYYKDFLKMFWTFLQGRLHDLNEVSTCKLQHLWSEITWGQEYYRKFNLLCSI